MLSGVVLSGGFLAEQSPCCGAAALALLQALFPERWSVAVLPGRLLAAADALHGPDSVKSPVQSEPWTLAMLVMANARNRFSGDATAIFIDFCFGLTQSAESVADRQVQAKTADTANCFSTSEACVAMAMHEQGISCLRSGGGKMVVVLFDGAARLCTGINAVSIGKGHEVYAPTSANK